MGLSLIIIAINLPCYMLPWANHFVFITGLFCPRSGQTSLTEKCLKVTIPWISLQLTSCVLWWHYCSLKNPRSSTGLEIRPQSVFPAFRTVLLSANFAVEWFGPAADSNCRFTHSFCSTSNNHYCQQGAPTSDTASSNFKKKCAKLSFLSAEGCHTPLNGHHCHLRTYHSFFSRA